MIDINGSVNRKDLDKTKSSAHFSQIGYLANLFFLIQMWKSYASWRVAPSNFVWLLAEIIADAVQVSMDQNQHHTMKARRNHQVTRIHRVMSLIGLLLSTMSLSGCGSLMLNSHLASSSESVIAMRVEENHIGLNPSSFSFAGSSTASNHVSCGDKEHVYIFLINGLDLLHYADMPGLAQHLRSLGYCRVYYSELLTANSLVEEIQQVARQDSQARFVLIGYSFGANWA
ncbi:MAG: hypothetical protein RMJ82_13595, partial [Gemmatales bacterium]|nr:hypothetical protein [Gemmatales bacterium]